MSITLGKILMSKCRGCEKDIEPGKVRELSENPEFKFGPYPYCFECFMTLLNRSSSGGETARARG